MVSKSKYIALCLILMAFSLSACGKKANDTTAGTTGGATAGSDTGFAYKADFKTLNLPDSVYTCSISGDNLYYVLYETVGGGQTPSGDYEEAISRCKIYKYSISSGIAAQIPYTLGDNVNVNNLFSDSDGNIHILTGFYDYTANDGTTQNLINYIILDNSGKEILDVPIVSWSESSDYFYINQSAMDEAGNLFYIDSENNLGKIDPTGKISGPVAVPVSEADESVTSLAVTGMSNPYIMKYRYTQTGSDGKMEYFFHKVDFETNTLGSEINFDRSDVYFNGTAPVEGQDAFYANAGTALIKVDPSSGKSVQQFLWINTDINSDTVVSFDADSAGNFRVFLNEYDYDAEISTSEMVTLTQVDASELPKKAVITYAVPTGYTNNQADILSFNRRSNDYHIEVIMYSSGNYDENLKRFAMDLAAGNVADIIEWPYDMDPAQYGAKGILMNLGDFIDSDADIKREDFIPGLLDVFTTNGQIYAFPYCFSVETLLVSENAPGAHEGWSIEEFLAYSKSRNTDIPLLEYMNKTSAMDSFMRAAYAGFVDWNTGQCSFDTSLYQGILELCNSFPDSIDWEEMSDNSALYPEGKLMVQAYFSSASSFEHLDSQQFQGVPYVAVGFPGDAGGNGAIVSNADSMLAISSKTKNADAAWQFIRQKYLYAYQTSRKMWAYPVISTAFDEQVEEYIANSQEQISIYSSDADEASAATDSDSGGLATRTYEANTAIYDNTAQDIDPVKVRENAQFIKGLVLGATRGGNLPTELKNIINEEAQKYFNGQTNAETAAKNTQNRAQLYVDEIN